MSAFEIMEYLNIMEKELEKICSFMHLSRPTRPTPPLQKATDV